MSDENSFGSVATQEAPQPVSYEASEGRSRRPLLIVGGITAVVLAGFAYLLFGGSGSAEQAGAVVVVPAAPAPVAAPSQAPAKPTDDTSSATVKVRDPFKPLVVPAPAASPAGTTNTTVPDPTASTPTAPTGETVTVTLVAVGGDVVKTTVDGTTYKGLSAGETFATNFQVYAIFNDSCAGFLYGDTSFALCEGKSTTLAKL